MYTRLPLLFFVLLLSLSIGISHCGPEATQEPGSEQRNEQPGGETQTEATQEPTAEITQEPAQEPPSEPAAEPTQEPTAEPAQEPSSEPTQEPPGEPTTEPTGEPTVEPTQEPAAEPTQEPTAEPTSEPTQEPIQDSMEQVTPPEDAGPMDGMLPDLPGPEITPEPQVTSIQGSVGTFLSGTTVAGAQVCIDGQPTSCQTTNAQGQYTLTGVPVGTDVFVTIQATGYMPFLIGFNIPAGTSVRPFITNIITAQELGLLATLLGIGTIDPTKGHLAINTFSGMYGSLPTPQTGVTTSKTPTDGQGPYYLIQNGASISSGTSTSSDGLVIYANIAPNQQTITPSHPSRTCTASSIEIQDAMSRLTPTIRAGWITLGAVYCQ